MQLGQSKQLNYSETFFTLNKKNSKNEKRYVKFKRKKLTYNGKESFLLTMTDVSTTFKYNKV